MPCYLELTENEQFVFGAAGADYFFPLRGSKYNWLRNTGPTDTGTVLPVGGVGAL